MRPRRRQQVTRFEPINFERINACALKVLPAILMRWLPDGQRRGSEWVCRNPRRDDRQLGSFSINMRSGKWADFASGDKGGDPVSLCAYLFDLSQATAARRIAEMLGIRP